MKHKMRITIPRAIFTIKMGSPAWADKGDAAVSSSSTTKLAPRRATLVSLKRCETMLQPRIEVEGHFDAVCFACHERDLSTQESR